MEEEKKLVDLKEVTLFEFAEIQELDYVEANKLVGKYKISQIIERVVETTEE